MWSFSVCLITRRRSEEAKMSRYEITQKTSEAVAAALELATKAGHAELAPLHVAVALISQPGGILRQAAANAAGSEDAPESLEKAFNQALRKLPQQYPPPVQFSAGTEIIKVFQRAHAVQQARGDAHLAVDQLILGLVEDSQIGDLFEAAGVPTAKVKSEVEKNRGEEGGDCL